MILASFLSKFLVPRSSQEGTMVTRFAGILALMVGLLLGDPAGAATLSGPSPYLCFDTATAPPGCGGADSPWKALPFGYFHLETFEDHLLNVPGVAASAGGVTSVVFGPAIHDSVDADDGTIDGSGLLGDSFFSFAGGPGISFTFSAVALGSLPTHAGLVWTDGGGTVTFRAFGPGSVELGACASVDGIVSGVGNSGQTDEDRFVGCSDPGGIERIFIRNSAGGIEVDHLQYGGLAAEPPPGVPEPATLLLVGSGLAALTILRRRIR